MAKRGVDPYPQASTLARTFLKDEVHLTASRQFMTSEGVIIYAAEKEGMAAVAGRTWLRPSAYRRAGDYLDLRGNPSICGFQVARRPTRQTQIDTLPSDLFQQFRVAAEKTKHTVIDTDRGIELRWCESVDSEPWTWQATVHYENFLKLADGHRIVADASVEIHARHGAGDTVDLAVVVARPGDLDVATAWLDRAIGSTSGWEVSPVGLNEDEVVRELRQIETELSVGDAGVLAWSNPHFDREIGVGAESLDDFVAGMRGARYDTEWYQLDTIESRVTSDAAAITHLQAIILEAHTRKGRNKDQPEPVIAVRLAQRRMESHLILSWQTGRMLLAEHRDVPLKRQSWEDMQRLDWDADAKRDYVLRRWANILTALAAAEADESEAAATGSA